MKYRFLVLAVALIAIIMLAAVAPTLHAQSSSSSSTPVWHSGGRS